MVLQKLLAIFCKGNPPTCGGGDDQMLEMIYMLERGNFKTIGVSALAAGGAPKAVLSGLRHLRRNPRKERPSRRRWLGNAQK